jgi:hypothetical protein
LGHGIQFAGIGTATNAATLPHLESWQSLGLGDGRDQQTSPDSFGKRLNTIVSRASSGPQDSPNKPAQAADVAAGGVYSQNAAGFINGTITNGGQFATRKLAGANLDSDGEGFRNFRFGESDLPNTILRQFPAEAKKRAEIAHATTLLAGENDESKLSLHREMSRAKELADSPTRQKGIAGGAQPALEFNWMVPSTNAWSDGSANLTDNRFALFGNEQRRLSEDSDKRSKLYRERLGAITSGSGIALPQVLEESLAEKPLRLDSLGINEAQQQSADKLSKSEKELGVVKLNELKGAAAGEPALAAQPQPSEADTPEKKELASLLAIRDRLYRRVWQEKVDQAMPREAIVEVMDKAEAEPNKKPTVWGRISGIFDSGAERTARIAIEKDATVLETQLLGGASTTRGFDPFWVQTQSEKIQSKEVLGKVIEKLNLNEAWAG